MDAKMFENIVIVIIHNYSDSKKTYSNSSDEINQFQVVNY